LRLAARADGFYTSQLQSADGTIILVIGQLAGDLYEDQDECSHRRFFVLNVSSSMIRSRYVFGAIRENCRRKTLAFPLISTNIYFIIIYINYNYLIIIILIILLFIFIFFIYL